MGKIIYCVGQHAVSPYYFKQSKIAIYTIEELCYYIYHHIDSIEEELFDPSLIAFLKNDLHMEERGVYLEGLQQKRVSKKDMVVSILCSTDYYAKEEIQELLCRMDEMERLSPMKRKKLRADLFLKQEKYKEAMNEYRIILSSPESQSLSSVEYGDILHNMGCLRMQMGAVIAASKLFLEAYERNERKESLEQYLYALKLGKQEDFLKKEIKYFVNSREVIATVESYYDLIQNETKSYPMLMQLYRLMEQRQEGNYPEYYEKLDALLAKLKAEYRKVSL